MTASRPYRKLDVTDLESIYEEARPDPVIFEAIVAELQHRSSTQAQTLLKRITSVLGQSATKSEAYSPKTNAASFPSTRPAPENVNAEATGSASTGPSEPIPGKARATPPVTNKATSILAAWTAKEALSPQTYRNPVDLAFGDKQCVASIRDDFPWNQTEPSRPNTQLYYQVILGSIPVDKATDALIASFGADVEGGHKEREKAALAAVLVDRGGYLLEDNAVGISSFGWALPIALSGDLSNLGDWTGVEKTLCEGLVKQLVNTGENGQPLPLDGPTLRRAFSWLVSTLKLPEGMYEEPSFALRVFTSKSQPETLLLNSFYLADLGRAKRIVDRGGMSRVLARYLGAEATDPTSNLLEDFSAIEALVAPAKTPSTRWPAPGGHSLVTLQQAAVNACRSELGGSASGIVSVNGPPGTGKTTLLRDVVAGCVLDRAKALANFDDPNQAFKASGQRVAAGGSAFLELFKLDESLKGHEVFVASSNNKAVENVSKELPALKAVGRDIAYFKTVSDRLLAKQQPSKEFTPGEPTWGLIAAVLGNAQNREAFQQAIWWDKDRSLRLYLKAAKGDSVVSEIKDEAGKIVRREVPAVIAAESPPNPGQAKTNWQKARSRFLSLQSEIEEALRALELIRGVCLRLAPARSAADEARIRVDEVTRKSAAQNEIVAQVRAALQAASTALREATKLEQRALDERPSWLYRVFNTRRMRNWRAHHAPLALAKSEAIAEASGAAVRLEQAEQVAKEVARAAQHAETKLREAQVAVTALTLKIDGYRRQLGTRMVDEVFFQQGHKEWNLESPWIPDSLHKMREDLFVVSMEVHRTFIDVAAQKVMHNLGVLMGAMQAGAFQEDAKKALLGDLWATLFLVCPVVSTTFASVDRMLGDLPPSSFGWLLIDEAGQATPQSAVGLLMRARKAIVVGDPLQIPPVVALPQRLITEIGTYFGISAAAWLAPDASVQTLADHASKVKARFRADVGLREVGIPLLVHRRCQEPMFGISNYIAYDGQMVHAAAKPPPGPVTLTLGNSHWIDVDGFADSKWCPAEGEEVVNLLAALARAGVTEPDIYVITPFRIVAQELRRRIEAEHGLLDALGVNPREWLLNRVGTIHTFQGKEAEAVIAVLGAPMSAQQRCATLGFIDAQHSQRHGIEGEAVSLCRWLPCGLVFSG